MREPIRLLAVLAILMGGLFALKAITVANGAADLWEAHAATMEQASGHGAPAADEEAPADTSHESSDAAMDLPPLGGPPAETPAPAISGPDPDFAQRMASGERTVDEERVIYRLGERSAELDRRQRELETREALMVALEQRVDGKIAELENLRAQIESLSGELGERENADMEVIVTWYAAMDAGDAAARIASLDPETQLQIASRMSRRTFGAILAAMDAPAAAGLTERMAARSNLPETVAELEARIAEGG